MRQWSSKEHGRAVNGIQKDGVKHGWENFQDS